MDSIVFQYRITPALPELCYVTREQDATKNPWEGVTAVHKGAGQPLQLMGPFDIPPYVQSALAWHFDSVFSLPEGERRAFVAEKAPWVVQPPKEEE